MFDMESPDAWPGPGSYRDLHTRLRENAEPVAFYSGIEKEGALVRTSFQELVKHRLRLLRAQWKFNMVQVRARAGQLRDVNAWGPASMLIIYGVKLIIMIISTPNMVQMRTGAGGCHLALTARDQLSKSTPWGVIKEAW